MSNLRSLQSLAQTLASTAAVRPNLTGPEARQQLLAEAPSRIHQEDWTRTAAWSSSNPQDRHRGRGRAWSHPVADGDADDHRASAKANPATVRVRREGHRNAPFTWSFRNHVIPVLTKMGCNQGACHGALAGKNGFKLTLRGYDPDVDYDTLTRQSVGRRVSLADPAASLMLLKPTFAIPHGGGKRFATDSLEYRVIVGMDRRRRAAVRRTATREIDGLEVFPASATLKPGGRAAIGGSREVLRLASRATSPAG